MLTTCLRSGGDIGRVVAVSIIIFFAIVAMLRVVCQIALTKISGYDVIFTGGAVASLPSRGARTAKRRALVWDDRLLEDRARRSTEHRRRRTAFHKAGGMARHV